MPVRVMVLSPHRDDAAFSLGLAIEGWAAGGHKVSVLNCFTVSEYAPYSDVESVHANDRASFVTAVRKREDVAWLKLLGGRVQMTDLDLLDAPLRLACPVEDVLTAEIRAGDRALARVAGAVHKLQRTVPEVAFVAPLGLGGHIDHRIVREAAAQLLHESPPVALAFYEDLPYAAACDNEAIASAVKALGFGLDSLLGPPVTAEPMDRKRRMADCYDSQVDSSVVDEIAGFTGRYSGRERLWGNAAWRTMFAPVPDEG